MSKLLEQAQGFIQMLPHARALGMELIDLKDAQAKIIMPYDEKLIGDPDTRVIRAYGHLLRGSCDGASDAPCQYGHN